jgi:hypothetical protein
VGALTWFGLLAVGSMLIFYALEERSPAFVLLFACACAASSLYGFLQGAWPFGIVEAVWTAVAVRRWRHRSAPHRGGTSRPLACDMSAFSADERQRYDILRRRVMSGVQHTVGTTTGVRLRLDPSLPPVTVAEWLALERRCCPFLNLGLNLTDDGQTWIELRGASPDAKPFIEGEFSSR